MAVIKTEDKKLTAKSVIQEEVTVTDKGIEIQDTICTIKIIISRDDLMNGRLNNKQEQIIKNYPLTKTESKKIDNAIVEFLNIIYETVQLDENGGKI